MIDTVFETETRWTVLVSPGPGMEPETLPGEVVSRYFASFSPARQAAHATDYEALGVPAGATVLTCTVYECSLNVSTPVTTVIGMLNGEIAPTRLSVRYGNLPLPFRAGGEACP